MKTAVITGARGQDASYLAELLLSKDYQVVAIERRSSSPDYSSIEHLFSNKNYVLEQGDLTDFGSLARVLQKYKPREFYNLAAMSFVAASWDQPIATCEADFVGTCNCLEAVRLFSPDTRFYQASTSEVYGDVQNSMQDMSTELRPRSPYGAAKAGAEHLVKVYRESYGMFACFARCFNHESKNRPEQFVTRKITKAVGDMVQKLYASTDIPHGLGSNNINDLMFEALEYDVIQPLRLGNLEAKRDWSHAADMVEGMWLMLQTDKPKDYVLASGETRSIKEFLDAAFGSVGIIDWSPYVVVDPKFFRPADVNLLCGDSSEIRKDLKWAPKYSFNALVHEMMLNDLGDTKWCIKKDTIEQNKIKIA